jgi:ferrous-iron efflux pump FieF
MAHTHHQKQSPLHASVTGETSRLMRLASGASVAVATLLFIIKGIAWWMTDSLSLLSSLADSMLDILTSLINLLAVRYALMPPDNEHRFGHGKAEELASLAQATFIAGTGVFICAEGIKRFLKPEPLANETIGIVVMIFSIVLTYLLVLFQRRVAAKTGSIAIHTDSVHYVFDVLTSGAVIAALLISQQFGWYWADAVFAALIALYIMYGAWGIGFKAFHHLMDHEFEDEEREKIKSIIRAHPEVKGLHDLKTRRSGIYRFIQCHVELDGNLTLAQATSIVDAIEDALMRAFPRTEVILHQDVA